jgi:protein-S-isoprenylcysteine O-methyltransferase Ste14
MNLSFAAISRSRTWDFLTRAIGVSCLALLGAVAMSAVLSTMRQLAAEGPNTSLIANLVVNVCIFVLMLIECTLIVSRPKAIAKAPGIGARVTALAGTWIIFLVVLIPLRTDLPAPWHVLAAILSTIGDLFAMIIVLHLGGSYSVMAEARRLVERGPYAVVRHPLYLAEQVTLLGALITYLSWRAVALFALQSFLQFRRARNEERILTRTFPGYAAYARRTPMLVPGWLPGGR